jgi:hypothetical protein
MGNYTTVFTTAQIITQLTTTWGGEQQGSTMTWAPGPISYAINTGVPPIPVPRGEGVGQQSMTSTQVALTQLSFQLWGDLISRQLVNVGTLPTANITLNYSSTTDEDGTYAVPGLTSPRPSADKTFTFTSDRIWLANNSDWPNNVNPTINNYGLTTMVHEVGHALGLSHPGPYNATPGVEFTYTGYAQFSQDTRQYNIMSYFGVYALFRIDILGNLSPGEGWTTDTNPGDVVFYAQTPMVYDIAAIQKLYGANMTTRSGDTIYGFHSNVGGTEQAIYDFSMNKAPIFTIWDAGGNNTIDGSLCTSAQMINLTPGSYSNVDGMIQNIAIAFNCIIQNAIGGNGNDILIGGNLGKVFSFTGGKGNDTITGGTVGISTSNYSGILGDYTVTISSSISATIQDNTANRDGTDSLTNVQRLHFTNVNNALDIAPNQNAGSVYMLYQAAFNRVADLAGMGYWLAQVDNGVNIVTGVAQSFVNSPEFITKYGANPSNNTFVSELYQNVLHRVGDAGGIAYWEGQLNTGATKALVLEQFATLPEGAALVAQTISHGIQYTLVA